MVGRSPCNLERIKWQHSNYSCGRWSHLSIVVYLEEWFFFSIVDLQTAELSRPSPRVFWFYRGRRAMQILEK